MRIITIEALAEILEPVVDEHGIGNVIEALALVASAKSDHIQSNWQDSDLAKRWDIVATSLLKSEYVARLNVGYGDKS